MTLEEILEKLHSPTDHAITLENGELTALLEELKGLREENKVLISECDRLILEVAVEDFEAIGEVHAAPTPMISPKHRDYMMAMIYAYEALKLIGGN